MTQAVICAMTSEFIQRLYYQNFVSEDGTLAGFVNFTLTRTLKVLSVFCTYNYSHVLAFNTARWNETVTKYPFPGPKWMKENQTVRNNFTCYFKVSFYRFHHVSTYNYNSFERG